MKTKLFLISIILALSVGGSVAQAGNNKNHETDETSVCTGHHKRHKAKEACEPAPNSQPAPPAPNSQPEPTPPSPTPETPVVTIEVPTPVPAPTPTPVVEADLGVNWGK